MPLGWELTTALFAYLALGVSLLLGLELVTMATVAVVAVVTPFVLLSAGIRLVAGIADEDRRHRRAKAMRARSDRS